MLRIKLACASGLLGIAYCVTAYMTWDVAPPTEHSAATNLATRHPEQAQSSAIDALFANASPMNGLTSPFAVNHANLSHSTHANLQAQSEERVRKEFQQSLRDYHFGTSSSEEKNRIKQSLHEVKRKPLARAILIETFFSRDEPQLAQSLYGLMRDADLKDVGLLEDLIEYDSRQRQMSNDIASAKATNAARLMDLIADLGAQDHSSYSAVVDRYLTQLATSADSPLRIAAATQRIWYLNQHQPNNLVLPEKYLADSAPKVREEVYSLIEARIANQTLSGQAQLGIALNAALHAEHLGTSAEEKARVSALLQALASSGA